MPPASVSATRFALVLRELLDEKRVSIRELGRRLSQHDPELGRRNVHHYLAAAHAPSEPTLEAIASALDVDADEIRERAAA